MDVTRWWLDRIEVIAGEGLIKARREVFEADAQLRIHDDGTISVLRHTKLDDKGKCSRPPFPR